MVRRVSPVVSSPKRCCCACRLSDLGCWVLWAWEVGGCFISLFANLHPGLSVGKQQPGCGAGDLGEVVPRIWGKRMAEEELPRDSGLLGTGEQAQQQDVTGGLAAGDWRLCLLCTRECTSIPRIPFLCGLQAESFSLVGIFIGFLSCVGPDV